jgi:hypothetical protein
MMSSVTVFISRIKVKKRSSCEKNVRTRASRLPVSQGHLRPTRASKRGKCVMEECIALAGVDQGPWKDNLNIYDKQLKSPKKMNCHKIHSYTCRNNKNHTLAELKFPTKRRTYLAIIITKCYQNLKKKKTLFHNIPVWLTTCRLWDEKSTRK